MNSSASFVVTVLALVAGNAISASADILRLGQDVVPQFQRIELTIDARKDTYEGKTEIELKVAKSTKSFRMHGEKLDIQSLSIVRDGEVYGCRYSLEDSATLRIEADEPLEPGVATLEIVFSNNFDRTAQGLFKVEVEGESYTFTQFEEDDAREAFPCFDEPSFKFPYQWVLTVPGSHLAVTNMPIEAEKTKGDLRTVTFQKSPALPSYLLALSTGPLDTVSIPGLGVPARVIATKGKAGLTGLAVELAPAIMKGMEEYFGGPYPYAKLDMIGVPEFWPGAMENPGLITFSEGVLLVEPAQAGVASKRRLATVMAHEFAHMWFGNLVTLAWWNDLWLNESFAEWLGEKMTHKLYPELGLNVSSAQSVGRTMDSDARPSAKPIRQPAVTSSDLTGNLGSIYAKGQAVLDMYEQYLGEDTFRRCIRSYVNDRAWSNATADDLFGTFTKEAGWDVGKALATFVDRPGIPLVSLAVEPSGKVQLRQSRFSNYGVELAQPEPWYIPLLVRYADGGEVKQQTVVLSEREMTVDLGTDGPPLWIMPHGDARAYCRWVVPYDMMKALAENAESSLSPRERVGYLGNLSALLDAGAISGDEYLTLVSGFRNDPHPQVLSAVAGAVDNVKSSFVPDSLLPSYDRYVRHTLRPALDRIGLERATGEDPTVTSLRPRVVGRLAESGDSAVVKHLLQLFDSYWTKGVAIDPDLRSLAIQEASRHGNRELYDSFKARFEAAQVPADRDDFLTALASFEDPEIQKDALAYALSGPLRPQEVTDIPSVMGSMSEAQSERIFQWYLDHFDQLVGKLPPMYRSYMPMIAGGCSLTRLERARAFFSAPEHASPGLESRLARVTDAVNECVSLREREGAKVASYLASDFETASTAASQASGGGTSGGSR